MTQLDFLTRPTDPQTSRDAAATVDVARSHRIVLEMFQRYGEMDDRLLCSRLERIVSESRARGARCELARQGLLEVYGTTGSPARRVWKLT